MFSLSNLIWLTLIGVAALYLWRSGEFKGRARGLASNHCRQLDLQLLDDSMVIVSLWPIRNEQGNLVLKRRFSFEFASIGDRRYQGEVIMLGMQLLHIELEPYKLPGENN